MTRGYGVPLLSSAILLVALFSPAHAQLADNLMVSGSEKPMAYGIGTYGLKGAGTQGVSGKSEAGGLYSARIPTVTLSRSVPGVMVSDGAGHAKVYNSNVGALGALAGIIGNNIDQQIKAHDQEQAADSIPGKSFLAAQAPQLAAQPSVSSTFYGQPALLTQDSVPGEDTQVLGRKMLQQQGAEGVATNLASAGTQALGSFANKVVSGVADLAQGKGPTITQGADGTLQVLTNNNSGDEVQFQRDGTLTWVNGGNAPGIFSVGPKGVHVEKDNVFNSQAYAAGAPSVTISNDPSTASSSTSTAYSGAAAQAPSASTYQNSQNTQGTYSSTNQAASSSGAGTVAPAPVSTGTGGGSSTSYSSAVPTSSSNTQAQAAAPMPGTAAPAPVYTGTGGGSSNTYSNAVPASSSDTQGQAPAPVPDASTNTASGNAEYATAPTAAAATTQNAGVETCCGTASSTSTASPPTQAYGNTQAATYFQAQQQQQQQQQVQDAQGPAAAAESFVTQALAQLQAQQGLPVTQMGAETGSNTGRRLLQPAAS